ncbi:MAG: ribosome-associated translation inhibitor RaiA [Phycisphaerae bacterium]
MQIQVTGRHVEVTEEIRDYIHTKAAKLPRFYNRVHDIEVVLGHESEQFSAEMIVRADRKHTFVASETGPDTFALIDLIVEKLERQLTKHKEKHRNRKHDGKSDLGIEG